MSCQIMSEGHSDRLVAYMAGTLPAESAAALELHMTSCPECAAIGRSQAAVWQALDAWQPGPVSADFDRRLYARIHAAEAAPLRTRIGSALREFFRPVLGQPAFALSAATLVIVAGFMLDHQGKMSTLGNNHAALHVSSIGAPIEVDQVEATLDDIEMLHQFDANADDAANPSKSM